ncbi:MAG: ATP-binding protein [bacterium]
MKLKQVFGFGTFKKNKRALVNVFASFISLSIFTTVIFMSGYYIFAGIALTEQTRIDKDINYMSIANMVRDINYKSIANVIFERSESDIKKRDFSNLSSISESLIKNNLVLYMGVIDKKTNIYKWSSVDDLINTKTVIGNPWLSTVFSNKFKNIKPEYIKEIYKNVDNDFIIVTGFFDNNALIDLINILLNGNLVLAGIFIVSGFGLAFILARFVTKPIKELVGGVEEFSRGNLKYRASSSKIDEIDKLAKSFNEMAEKLDILYSSLEQKVKDRTNELALKNLQLEKAYKELQETQTMLIHNEKMTSLGQLVAGVAHEINNPINFIYGNLDHLKVYTNNLIKIIEEYKKSDEKLPFENNQEINNIKNELDYEFIVEDLPSLIRSCKDGSERCKQIVLDLRNFSRVDEAVIKEIDIHEGIESTLNILRNKYKNRIVIHKEYGDVPKLSCYAGQLNQVILNVLDNAAQAIPDTGDVYIRTHFENNNIIMEFEDNGSGIDEAYLSKIFDPFFTTKPVGQGTGLGLSISYKIINKHNGTINVESQKNKGTKFTIKIPVEVK